MSHLILFPGRQDEVDRNLTSRFELPWWGVFNERHDLSAVSLVKIHNLVSQFARAAITITAD